MSRDKTHWDECWRVHHECAIAKIERLQSASEDRTYLDFCLRLNAARIGMNNAAIMKTLDQIDAHFHNMAGGH